MEKGGKVISTCFFLVIAMLGVLLVGCKPRATIPAEFSQYHPQVAALIALRSQSQASIMAQYIHGKKFVKYSERGRFKGYSKESYKIPPMFYTFEDSAVFYIGCSFRQAATDTATYSLSKLIGILGEPRRRLPSVLDYPLRTYIYPELGLDFNANVEKGFYDEVAVFQPTTWRKYKRYFWSDPSEHPSRHR